MTRAAVIYKIVKRVLKRTPPPDYADSYLVGGCLVLAEAVEKAFPRAKRISFVSDFGVEHVVNEIDGLYLDADGPKTPFAAIADFDKRFKTDVRPENFDETVAILSGLQPGYEVSDDLAAAFRAASRRKR